MFDWFRKAIGRCFRAAGTVEQIRHIEQRVVSIEKAQREIIAILTEKAWAIDKVVIENMRTDKVELNLERVDVQDLSGMLSIGINYGGSLVKLDGAGSFNQGDAKTVEKGTGIFGGTGREGPDKGTGRNGPPEPRRPVVNVQYGVRPDGRPE